MCFTKEIAVKELIWEYDFSEKQAAKIVDQYISENRFSELCDLLMHKRDKLREVLE